MLSSPAITEENDSAELTSGCKRVIVFSEESVTKVDISECPDPSAPCDVAQLSIPRYEDTMDSPTMCIMQEPVLDVEETDFVLAHN